MLFIFQDAFEFTCELDEYAYLKKELQESGIVKDIRSGLKSYKNAFYGKDAVSFLVQTKNLGNAPNFRRIYSINRRLLPFIRPSRTLFPLYFFAFLIPMQ